MSRELAVAYVNIVASASKVAPTVRQQLGVVEKDAAGTSSKISTGFKNAFAGATTTATALFTTLGGGIAALTAKGGFARALAIDSAEAKMVALGYTQGQVVDVMDRALQSVKGTAFGLGDAASLASQLLASGVKPGEDLTRVLGNTADMAAVANVGLTDLQSVMGQLVGKGQLYTQDLMQLGERGLPVFAWLAEYAGVTQEVVRDMVSDGKLQFSDLQIAIEQHIGGAAKKMDSFNASWLNVKAALSRGGAVVAVPILDGLKAAFDTAIPLIDVVTARLAPVVEMIVDKLTPGVTAFLDALAGNTPTEPLQGVVGILAQIGQTINGLITGNGAAGVTEALSGMGAVLGPLLAMIGASGASSLAGLFAPLGIILPTISPLVAGIAGLFVSLFTQSDALQGAFGTVFSTLGTSLQSLTPVLQPLGNLIGQVAGVLGDALASVITTLVVPAIGFLVNDVLPKLLPFLGNLAATLLPMVQTAFELIAPVLSQLAESLFPVLMDVLTAIAPVLSDIGGIVADVFASALELITPILEALTPVLTQVVDIVGDVLGEALKAAEPLIAALGDVLLELLPVVLSLIEPLLGIVEAFLPLLPVVGDLIGTLLPPLVELIMALLPVIVDVVKALVENLAPVLEWLAAFIADPLVPWWTLLIDVLATVITWVIDLAKAIVAWVVDALKQWYARVQEVTQGIRDRFADIVNIVTAMVDTWKSKIGDAVLAIVTLKDKVYDAFSSAKDWLYNAGKAVIDGFIDGVKANFTKVKDTLTDLTDKLPDWKGPAEKDRTVLVRPGQIVMDSFETGLESRFSGIRARLGDFTASLTGTPAVAPAVAGGGDTFNVDVHVDMDRLTEIKDLTEFIAMLRVLIRQQGIAVR